jgi:hypothetical protein
MFLDGVVANLLPPEISGRVVRIREFARDVAIPDEATPWKVKNLTGGAPHAERILADPQGLVATARTVAQSGDTHPTSGKSAEGCQAAAPSAAPAEPPRWDSRELAPGSRALQVDCCAFGSSAAGREQPPRFAITLSDDELMGRG